MTNSILTRARLQRLTAGKQVVVLEGPSGYGKTTFGEQLLMTAELASARVRLTRTTDGPGLIDAIVRGSRRAGLSDLASSAEGSPDGALDRLIGALAQREDPVMMMIDEAQLLDPDGVETLADLAGDLPDRCRLVIAGRRLPAGRFGRPGKTVVIDGTTLRFDADEVEAMIGAADTRFVADVLRATDGWPAAIALLASNLGTDPTWSPNTAVDERRVVETLLEHLLSATSPAMRDAVGTLAHYPYIDGDIVEHIAGPAAPAAFLEIGLPLQHLGRWTVVPDAIRELLRSTTTPNPALTRWIAFHYVDAGDLAVAISTLAGAGHTQAIAELLADLHWGDLEALGLGTVRVLIELIDDHLCAHPRALVNAVRAADRRDHVLKVAWVSKGLALFPDGPERRALLAEKAIEAARSGDMAGADLTATVTLDHAAAIESATRGRASLAKGMAHAFRSTPAELRKAEVVLDDAVANFRVAGETRWEAYALDRSAYLVSFKRGAFTRAAEQLETAITLGRAESRDRLTTLTSYAEVLCMLGRIDEARAAATEALTVGRRWADPLAIGFAAWTLAWIAAYSDDAEATHQALRIVADSPGPWLEQYSGHEFHVDAALMMTMIDDRQGLAHYTRLAGDHAHRNEELMTLLEARSAATDGDPRHALELLGGLEGTAYADPGLAWQRLMITAVAELRSGNEQRAAELVRLTLRATDEIGLADLPERLEARLVRILAPVWPRADERSAKSLIHVTMFGGFSLRRGGDDCTPAIGNGATMVKLLALRGDTAVEQMIDELWPDTDLATGRARLRNLLNRVRSQSGEVIVRRGDTLSLHPDVVVDVTEFERAAADVYSGEAARRAGAARLVLAAYSGELLPGDAYEDWAAAPRERLKRRFLSLVDIVVDDSLDRGDLDDAVRWLDVAIATEPLEESRYIRVCEALLVQGRRATAREVGERAVTMLQDLGMEPSRQLRTVLASVDAA